MVLHAALISEDVVILAASTDFLILMIYAYSKLIDKQRWVFRCEDDKFAVIEAILSYLGKLCALVLLIYSFIMTS